MIFFALFVLSSSASRHAILRYKLALILLLIVLYKLPLSLKYIRIYYVPLYLCVGELYVTFDE